MITSLRAGEIDVGIGLTEGWVAGLGKEGGGDGGGGYRIVGTYVETPLCICHFSSPQIICLKGGESYYQGIGLISTE
jgi:hypothetical protein